MERTFNQAGLRTYALLVALTGLIGINGGWSAATAGQASSPPSSQIALKNVKDVVRRVRTAALDLVNDVEQRSMVVTGDPDIIDPIAYKDKKALSWARQMLELGPAEPPRQEWLDVDMSHLGKLVNLLSSDLAAGGFSGESQAPAKQMTSIMTDVQLHYKNLKGLTAGPKYDNIAIGKEALAIYDDMSKFDKPWKSALSMSKKG